MLHIPRQNNWHFSSLLLVFCSNSLSVSFSVDVTSNDTLPTNQYYIYIRKYILSEMLRLFKTTNPYLCKCTFAMASFPEWQWQRFQFTINNIEKWEKNGRRIFVDILWFGCFLFLLSIRCCCCCNFFSLSHAHSASLRIYCEWKNFL